MDQPYDGNATLYKLGYRITRVDAIADDQDYVAVCRGGKRYVFRCSFDVISTRDYIILILDVGKEVTATTYIKFDDSELIQDQGCFNEIIAQFAKRKIEDSTIGHRGTITDMATYLNAHLANEIHNREIMMSCCDFLCEADSGIHQRFHCTHCAYLSRYT